MPLAEFRNTETDEVVQGINFGGENIYFVGNALVKAPAGGTSITIVGDEYVLNPLGLTSTGIEANWVIQSEQIVGDGTWSVIVENQTTGDTKSGVLPFNQTNGNVYTLECEATEVIASCGGYKVEDTWGGKSNGEWLRLKDTLEIICHKCAEGYHWDCDTQACVANTVLGTIKYTVQIFVCYTGPCSPITGIVENYYPPSGYFTVWGESDVTQGSGIYQWHEEGSFQTEADQHKLDAFNNEKASLIANQDIRFSSYDIAYGSINWVGTSPWQVITISNGVLRIDPSRVTTAPTLSLSTDTAPTSTDITVTITNFSATSDYTVAVTGGSTVRADGVITWTTPATAGSETITVRDEGVTGERCCTDGAEVTESITVGDCPEYSYWDGSSCVSELRTLNQSWLSTAGSTYVPEGKPAITTIPYEIMLANAVGRYFGVDGGGQVVPDWAGIINHENNNNLAFISNIQAEIDSMNSYMGQSKTISEWKTILGSITGRETTYVTKTTPDEYANDDSG